MPSTVTVLDMCGFTLLPTVRDHMLLMLDTHTGLHAHMQVWELGQAGLFYYTCEEQMSHRVK